MNNSQNAVVPNWLRRFWSGIGWFGVALLIYLSLAPKPPTIDMAFGDKIGHLLAYGTLMFWWAQHFGTTRKRFELAAALIALGIAIEFVQGWTGWRAFEYADMVADAAGVLLGGVIASLTPNILLALAYRIGARA